VIERARDGCGPVWEIRDETKVCYSAQNLPARQGILGQAGLVVRPIPLPVGKTGGDAPARRSAISLYPCRASTVA
jgi:hypothetical protein